MWQLLYHWLSCQTGSKSIYCSLLWVLLVLSCLALYAGWLNLQSVARWIVGTSRQKPGISGREIRTTSVSGSESSSPSTGCYPNLSIPQTNSIQTISTFVNFSFLVLSLFIAVATLVRAFPHPLTSYEIQIDEKLDSYNYIAHEIDPLTNMPTEALAGTPHLWQECLEPSHGDFDPGMRVFVTFEDLGCKSFRNQEHGGSGWTVVRDSVTHKFIDFRSVSWITPTTKQSQP